MLIVPNTVIQLKAESKKPKAQSVDKRLLLRRHNFQLEDFHSALQLDKRAQKLTKKKAAEINSCIILLFTKCRYLGPTQGEAVGCLLSVMQLKSDSKKPQAQSVDKRLLLRCHNFQLVDFHSALQHGNRGPAIAAEINICSSGYFRSFRFVECRR